MLDPKAHYLTYAGRRLEPAAALGEQGIGAHATLQVVPRLPGGGCCAGKPQADASGVHLQLEPDPARREAQESAQSDVSCGGGSCVFMCMCVRVHDAYSRCACARARGCACACLCECTCTYT